MDIAPVNATMPPLLLSLTPEEIEQAADCGKISRGEMSALLPFLEPYASQLKEEHEGAEKQGFVNAKIALHGFYYGEGGVSITFDVDLEKFITHHGLCLKDYCHVVAAVKQVGTPFTVDYCKRNFHDEEPELYVVIMNPAEGDSYGQIKARCGPFKDEIGKIKEIIREKARLATGWIDSRFTNTRLGLMKAKQEAEMLEERA